MAVERIWVLLERESPVWTIRGGRRRRLSGGSMPSFSAQDDSDAGPFNGYGDQVASLYAGMDLKKYY